eukprot:TRINITY_DN13722_c0_g1_i1.p1 TRINITY_DN13722_c0_g1~~TRINITY_DN13722_c0_g1_i1.p1  ORF type:complete len:446 (+),score=61.42 TRINITY_DN13722_c0_g1_i1:43-1380(+)
MSFPPSELIRLGSSLLVSGPSGAGKAYHIKQAASQKKLKFRELEPIDIYSLKFEGGEHGLRPFFADSANGSDGCLLVKHVERLLEDTDLWGSFEDLLQNPPRNWCVCCTARSTTDIPGFILSKFSHCIESPTPSLAQRSELISNITRGKPMHADAEWIAGRLGGVPEYEIHQTLTGLDTKADFIKASRSRISVMEKTGFGGATVAKTEWKDVKGHETVKSELQTALSLFKSEKSVAALGLDGCNGILLYGLPGNGKTMLAKAVATEMGGTFLYGSIPGLVKGFVGESERMVRELFSEAGKNAPCCLFLDEIQAVFGAREASGDHDSRIVSTLLTCIDNVPSSVLLLAATNTPHQLDSSLLVPGRLDMHIHVTPPSHSDRSCFFVHNGVSAGLAGQLASDTENYSYSDLAAVMAISKHCPSLQDAVRVTHPSADPETLRELCSWKA